MVLQYEIDSNNTVKIFDPTQIGSIVQPNWPNGKAWANADEAKTWAELYIASVEDEDAPFAPNARGETGKAKPTAKQRKAIQDAFTAIQDAKTPEEIELAQQALQNAYSA